MSEETYKFYCTHCGQRIEANASVAGTEVCCPICSRRFTAPYALAQPPPLPNTTPPPVSPPHPRSNLLHLVIWPAWFGFNYVGNLAVNGSYGRFGFDVASAIGLSVLSFVFGGVIYFIAGGRQRGTPGFIAVCFFGGAALCLGLMILGKSPP